MCAGKELKLLGFDKLEMAAECLRTVAHPCRLRMLQMLLSGSYTVGELAEACDIQSHIASEHLRLMKHCGLLRPERDGRKTYYQVAEEHIADLMKCIEGRFGDR
jgi:DNA-binding transcriptional ArsR family regulator